MLDLISDTHLTDKEVRYNCYTIAICDVWHFLRFHLHAKAYEQRRQLTQRAG